MFDKISWFFIDRAYAETNPGNSGKSFFDFFKIRDPGSGSLRNPELSAQNLIGVIITWLLAIAAVIAFIYLVFNGINYITAGGDAEKATKARNGILNAIIGIAVIAIAFVIMRFATGVGGFVQTQLR